MKFDAFDRWVRTLPGVRYDVKWQVDRTYCLGDKMFVVAGSLGETAPRYVFKTSDLAFEMLVESGAAEPAPYLARAKWVKLKAADSLTESELKAYVEQAHELIAGKLTQKQRAALGIEG